MIYLLVFGAAVAATGLLSALHGVQSGERNRVAGGAAYLAALVGAVVAWTALSLTVWEDNAQVVDRTTGTVERLLQEDAVVRVAGTQERVLAPRIPHRPQEGDQVLVTVDRVGLYTARLDRTVEEVDATIAANERRRPPAPVDALALLIPVAAGAGAAGLVHRRHRRTTTRRTDGGSR